MNKKTIIKIVVTLSILLLVVLVFNLPSLFKHGEHITEDARRFKAIYEALNGEFYENDPEFTFKTITIPENNPFRFVSLDEIINLIINDGTAVIYLGWPDCNWCRNLVPVLTDAAIEFGVNEILYNNIYEDRDILELVRNEIREVRAGSPYYLKLLELLGDYAPVYREILPINDGTIRRIYAPAVLFIKNGEIIRYQGNLHSFQLRINQDDELTSWDSMNENEIDELKHIFLEYFARLFD